MALSSKKNSWLHITGTFVFSFPRIVVLGSKKVCKQHGTRQAAKDLVRSQGFMTRVHIFAGPAEHVRTLGIFPTYFFQTLGHYSVYAFTHYLVHSLFEWELGQQLVFIAKKGV